MSAKAARKGLLVSVTVGRSKQTLRPEDARRLARELDLAANEVEVEIHKVLDGMSSKAFP